MSSPNSSISSTTTSWIPNGGFRHRKPATAGAVQRSVLEMRNDRFNREVTTAVNRLAIRDRTVLNCDARAVLVEALERVAYLCLRDDRQESTLDFLERVKDEVRLGRELSTEAWIKMIYRLV